MNFFLDQTAMPILDKVSKALDFLARLAKGKWDEKKTKFPFRIASISPRDYLAYEWKYPQMPFDLLFTRTGRKEIQPHLSSSLVKLLLDMAHNDFRSGGRLRRQGQMQSITIPGTRQQKVLLFVSLMMEKYHQGVQLILGVDDAMNWNTHGKSLSHENNFRKRALDAQDYYRDICGKCLAFMQEAG